MICASFPLRAGHRPSCLLCALRDTTQGGDGLAFLGLFEKPDKGKRSIVAFSANWGEFRDGQQPTERAPAAAISNARPGRRRGPPACAAAPSPAM
jgi:hypothetical protein